MIGPAIANVAVFKNVSLANEVIGLIIKVLGDESGLVNPVEIELALVNMMLFDQFDRLGFLSRRQVLLSFGMLSLGLGHFGSG